MHKLTENQVSLDKSIRDVLSECTKRVRQYDNDARVILYGSQARRQATEHSDLDLLVLLSSDIPNDLKNQMHDSIYEVALDNDIVISTIIKTSTSWEEPISQATPLYQSIQNEGILVA